MKRILSLTCILAAAAILTTVHYSCNKSSAGSSSNNSLSTQPVAQAAYDSQSGGVYKGSLTGSSGYFEINLQASTPYIIYQWTNPQGGVDSLFSTSLANWQSGQGISKGVFSSADGSVFWFSVAADGTNPTIDSVYIPSHNGPVYAAVLKELSGAQVKVYEGTGTAVNAENGQCVNGILNLTTGGTNATGSFLASNGNEGGGIGTISGSQIQLSMISNSNNADSGVLTISTDGNTITGSLSSNTCTHTVTLTRIF
jgi:hypothetical protein